MPGANRTKKDLDFEIKFYEGILKRDPNLVDVLIPLGDTYTKRGYYKKGLEVDLKLSRLSPKDPVVFYNLACSYSLLKETTPAMESLEKAFVLGYRDFKFLMSDPDLKNLRGDPGFDRLLQKYRKSKKGQA
jgi:tetratricopeptide (TPR) repeat protein